ncbi:SRPBCC domain-containing protein, partial [Streptomyces caeruleatus]
STDTATAPTASAATYADRIERRTLLQAPRERVWRALTEAEEFGRWFGIRLDGQHFESGRRNRAQLSIKAFEHVWLELAVERIEPQTTFAYRW